MDTKDILSWGARFLTGGPGSAISGAIGDSHREAWNDPLLANNDNVSSADDIINKQTNPANKNPNAVDYTHGLTYDNQGNLVYTDVGANSKVTGELDADGNRSGYSSIQNDINGDPDGGSLLDAALQDDKAIQDSAAKAVTPYTDPATGMKFDSHDAYSEWVDKNPFRHGWAQRDPDTLSGWNPMSWIPKPRDWKILGGTGQSPSEVYEAKSNLAKTKSDWTFNKEQKEVEKGKREDAERKDKRREALSEIGKSLMDYGANQEAFKYELF
jgi:uncharacterized membrane protein